MLDVIMDAVIDAAIDTVKILPFLLITYLLMEYLESKMQSKTKAALHKTGKFGPILGSVLGIVPQCGFSTAASSLYAGRVITMGTLIAIFLSTSDEMLPIMISEAVNPMLIGSILLVKVVCGIIVGFIVDIVYRVVTKHDEPDVDIHHFCEHEHCHCGHGIIKPALRHTIQIAFFILIISIILNIVIGVVGIDSISNSVFSIPVVGELIAGLIGLIPNCAASVVITELYVSGAINFGTMIAGLLVGAGVGVLVLFRVNESIKENLVILSVLYFSGVILGILINLIL